ncbi:MAG TPA: Calx-beta domain-containing protein, partial [Candidatus Dormibacteraeota bacterium]|nr:Calx-beta domain-containing protein [Candidatus Dormibacteraeota bacterium]
EVFSVILSNPTNAMLAKAQGDCTIVDDDALPMLSINNAGVVEGNSGTTNAVFTVTLSPVSGQAVTVDFATTNGTAIAGIDYLETSDTITFDAGQTSRTLAVPVIGDALNEASEMFLVNLANPVAATLSDGQGVGTITNDDLLPNIDLTGAVLTVESCLPANGAIDPGENVSVSFTLKNASTGTAATTNLVATLLATGGIISPGSPQNYGALTAGSSASKTFTLTASGACGGTIAPSIQLQDGPNNLGTVTNVLLLGKPIITFTQSFDDVTTPNLPAGWTASLTGTGTVWVSATGLRDTPPNSVFAPDPDGTSDNRLTSPSIPIRTASARLTFRHNFSTEEFFDGGVLEISIGGGAFTNILAAGGSFSAGGYNGAFNNDITKPAWTGISDGFITTAVNLPASTAGQAVQLSWRFLSDIYGAGVGWYVDSVSITDGTACCGNAPPPSLSATLSGANVVVCWTSNAAGYALQSTTNLSPFSIWATVTSAPVLAGNQFCVTNSVAGDQRFYRLIQ